MQVSTGESANHLPLVLPIEENSSDGYCECLIRGRSQRGILVKFLAIIESRGIRVLSCSYESSADSGAFGASLILQLEKNSDSETLSLVEKLMDTRTVSSVEFAPLKGKFFANFRFPIVVLPGERGVIIQPEALVESVQEAGQLSAAAVLETGRKYGHSFASQSRGKSGKEDIVIQVLRATGWGTGKYEENEMGEVIFVLKDPAIGVDTEFEDKSRFIVGLIQGMLEEILGCQMRVLNDRFDGKTNSLVVKLIKTAIQI
jgi:acetolactate synthase regulatory subunit